MLLLLLFDTLLILVYFLTGLIFNVLSFALDFDFDDEQFDFLDNGGFDDGGRILLCDPYPILA